MKKILFSSIAFWFIFSSSLQAQNNIFDAHYISFDAGGYLTFNYPFKIIYNSKTLNLFSGNVGFYVSDNIDLFAEFGLAEKRSSEPINMTNGIAAEGSEKLDAWIIKIGLQYDFIKTHFNSFGIITGFSFTRLYQKSILSDGNIYNSNYNPFLGFMIGFIYEQKFPDFPVAVFVKGQLELTGGNSIELNNNFVNNLNGINLLFGPRYYF